MPDNAAFAGLEDLLEVIDAQRVADHAHREAADELRLETVLDEVRRLGVLKDAIALDIVLFAAGEADGGLLQPPIHNLVEMRERAAHDEQDVFRVDCVAAFFAASRAVHHRLDLAGHVVRGAGRHLGFLHQLEQGGLYALAAHVAAAVLLGGGGDLVNFVDVNDPILGAFDIAVGLPHEVADEILDIAADVAGLGKLGGIGLDERHTDQLGDAANEVRFPDAGWPHQHDVLLGVVALFFPVERLAHGVVVVAQRHAQHLLGFVLLDDIAVEMGFYVPWLVGKTEVIALGLRLGFLVGAGRLRTGKAGTAE